jgi:hypothetical protein
LGELVMSAMMDLKGSMVAAAVANSGFCDWLPWTKALTEAHLAFGSFYFWPLDIWDNLLSFDLCHSHDTCSIGACLSFVHDLALSQCGLLFDCASLFYFRSFAAFGRAVVGQKFSPNFLMAHNH